MSLSDDYFNKRTDFIHRSFLIIKFHETADSVLALIAF